MQERPGEVVARAVIERARDDVDLFRARLVDVATRPRRARVHLQHLGVLAVRSGPQRTAPDAGKELKNRGRGGRGGDVALLGEDLGMHTRGARLVTICSGVFALARTGLLDGRLATAHWTRAQQLRREFPLVRVDIERPYVDHGDVATSAGAGAGIELCLHLARRDHGDEYAELLARHMAMPPRPDGGRGQPAPCWRTRTCRWTRSRPAPASPRQ